MTKYLLSIKTLADLRKAVNQGKFRVSNQNVVNIYLDLVEDLIEAEFHEREFMESISAFNIGFPTVLNSTIFSNFEDEALYRRLRKCLLELMRLNGHAEGIDLISHLNVFAKRDGIASVNKSAFRRAFPTLSPARIGRSEAIEADRPLRGLDRQMFRKAMATLDRIRCIDEVQVLGLLGPDPIGMLPQYVDGDRLRLPIPTKLKQIVEGLNTVQAGFVSRVFNIGAHAGILAPDEDLPELSVLEDGRLSALEEAIQKTTSAGTAKLYINAFKRAVGWTAQAKASRQCIRQQKEAMAKAVKLNRARAQKLPEFVEVEIADFQNAAQVPPKKIKTLRAVIRRLLEERASVEMDDLLHNAEIRLSHLLNDLSALTVAHYMRNFRAFLKHRGHECPWMVIMGHLAGQGITGAPRRGLATVRRLARDYDPTLMPADITSKVAEEIIAFARDAGKKHEVPRLRRGFAVIDALRPSHPDLVAAQMIGEAISRSPTRARQIPENILKEVHEHARFHGFTASSEKALITALCKLYELTEKPDLFDLRLEQIPFAELIGTAIRKDPGAMRVYKNELLRLHERLQIRWTPGWISLQNGVVAAGVSRADNPIDALLAVANLQGLEPWQIDREWAFSYERGLRPDLRLTWSRNIDRFDALRDIVGPEAATLLPTMRLGPMPARGTRLKNAVYPLPLSVETALQGEGAQLLEAAHFAWRCARDLGLFERGDAPDTSQLFGEKMLDHVQDHQQLISHPAARLHRKLLEDWKRRRLDHDAR